MSLWSKYCCLGSFLKWYVSNGFYGKFWLIRKLNNYIYHRIWPYIWAKVPLFLSKFETVFPFWRYRYEERSKYILNHSMKKRFNSKADRKLNKESGCLWPISDRLSTIRFSLRGIKLHGFGLIGRGIMVAWFSARSARTRPQLWHLKKMLMRKFVNRVFKKMKIGVCRAKNMQNNFSEKNC